MSEPRPVSGARERMEEAEAIHRGEMQGFVWMGGVESWVGGARRKEAGR